MSDVRNAWQLSAEEAAASMQVGAAEGLGDAAIARLRAEFGPNRLTPQQGTSAFVRFLRQFHQALVYILLAAAGVTFYLDEVVDSAVIFAVVLVNAIVGYLQESKAEKALDALARMVVTEATVRRNGRKQRVPSESLVPGDIVLLQSGDRVPADLRFLLVRSLQVDESMLTGESVPVEKAAGTLPADTVLADRRNMAFAGSMVTYGQAEGVVWSTGDRTEMGRISTLMRETTSMTTPFLLKMEHFSRLLLYVILGLAAATFAVGVLRGKAAMEMFMAAVALAVGAIPEGLPAAVTITLAVGVARMARRRAIIRKLPAVETLGSTTVICSDKTGTLTENAMTVERVWAGGASYEITGTGYDTEGSILREGAAIAAAESVPLLECLKAGVLCNDTQLVVKDGRTVVEGDPTEAALIAAAGKTGRSAESFAGAQRRVATLPFESEHQYMATLHESERETTRVVYVKGSVERVLERCARALDARGEASAFDASEAMRTAEEMAARGLRVLAFARKEMPRTHSSLEHGDVARDLVFIGLQGMIDPPRAEAVAAVGKCRRAGIEVKMITGDHLLTAAAIAEKIGLGSRSAAGRVAALSGRDLEKLSDEELVAAAEKTDVFARVAPEQKLRLVRALQARGHVTAMTGDGVNDAPALKQADIGIAMGITGTDVAKHAADMVLTDDNFASIEAAVEEGRGVFDNLTKFIIWTLPTNAGEAAVLFIAILLGTALPILPVQLLWVNMTTALLLGLMLVFEPKEEDLMQRPPRNPKLPLLTPTLVLRILMVTAIMAGGALALFYWGTRSGNLSEAEGRTLVVNVIVVVEMFYLLACRSLTRSMFSVGLLSNPRLIGGIAVMLLAQLAFTYVPVMQTLFHSAPLGLESWLWIAGVGAAAYAATELEKMVRRKRE